MSFRAGQIVTCTAIRFAWDPDLPFLRRALIFGGMPNPRQKYVVAASVIEGGREWLRLVGIDPTLRFTASSFRGEGGSTFDELVALAANPPDLSNLALLRRDA